MTSSCLAPLVRSASCHDPWWRVALALSERPIRPGSFFHPASGLRTGTLLLCLRVRIYECRNIVNIEKQLSQCQNLWETDAPIGRSLGQVQIQS